MGKDLKSFNDIAKEFNMWVEEPESIRLINPVLNGMFNGALPLGSVTQIAAQSGVGKSTLAIQMARELCDLGYRVAYIDSEKGLNLNMLKSTGIYKHLYTKETPEGTFTIIKECDCGRVNDLILHLSNNKLVDFIFLDSLGALDSGLYDIGGTDANTPKVGADTKSVKIVMKTMNKCAITNNTTFIFINHLAQSIGTYIPTENPTGGRAPIYFSDFVIKLTKKSSEFEKMRAGQKVEFEATKSRYGNGKAKIPFYIRFGQGIAMIPTYREAIEDLKCNGKPLLEVRGGGNGSLWLGDKEYKYRGENQLLSLIGSHYEEIKSVVPDDLFCVKAPDLPDWTKVNENDMFLDREDSIDFSPSKNLLGGIEPIDIKDNNLIYDKGVDSVGQQYKIYYDIESNTLNLDYDSMTKSRINPTEIDLKEFREILDKYIKSL